jgi:hypothetical protein
MSNKMIQNGSQNSSLNLMESAQLGKTNQIIPYTGRKTIKTTIAVKKCEMFVMIEGILEN